MMQTVCPNLFEIRLGGVNVFLIKQEDELILVDTGSAGDDAEIAAALSTIEHTPADLTQIIVTHCHPDHAGALAALQAQTAAVTIMHETDAAMVRQGNALRPLTPAPGLLNRILFRFFIASAPDTIEEATVDETVEDGDVLSLAGGLRVLHVPGHSAGQIALLWEPAGVLFAADAVMNQPWLRHHIAYEDYAQGEDSATRLAQETFDIACFGHGKPLVGHASDRFLRTFSVSR